MFKTVAGQSTIGNRPSKAILFYSAKEFRVRKVKISNDANHNEMKELDAMKAYCENTERLCLLKHFDGHDKAKEDCSVLTKHECCDICLPLCKCDKCVENF